MNFLFYDYETTGTDPAYDQVVQFSAIKTDAAFNPVEEPVNLFCRIRSDVLPSPWAFLTTEIDVDMLEEKGMDEFSFAREVNRVLSGQGNQCICGYNSKSFDDKFSQFLLYRNFLDPYRWGWDTGNKKLDVYDIVLMGYGFDRLSGLRFSEAGGTDSLKLENLSALNGLTHLNAHDALSDVTATIDLVKRIQTENPRLLEYAIKLQDKAFAGKIITGQPVFYHVSSYYGYESKFVSLHRYLAPHPLNRNSLICWNLNHDPTAILDLDVETIRKNLYARKEEREREVGFTDIKINQNPAVLAFAKDHPHPMINLEKARGFARTINSHQETMIRLATQVYHTEMPFVDPDGDLYAGNFFSERDTDQETIHKLITNGIEGEDPEFISNRFNRLYRRLKARNFPLQLTEPEKNGYGKFLHDRFFADGGKPWRTYAQYEKERQEVNEKNDLNVNQKMILDKLDKQVQAKVAALEKTA